MTRDVPTAFFSYCHEDSDFALRLAGDLKAAGANVWLDQLDIVPGQRWDRAVENALINCSRMLVILSPSSVDSTNVMDEVSFALEEKKAIIPVIHKDCKVPFRLRRVQYVDFRQDYARGLRELLKTLVPEQKAAQSTPAISGVHSERETDVIEAGKHGRTAEEGRSRVSGELTQAGELDRNRGVQQRLIEALKNPKWEWRSLKQLAIEAAVSEEKVADLLRSDPRVRFGKNKSLGVIVALRARVRDTQTSATQQTELAAPPGKKSTIDMPPPLPDAAGLINTGPGPNKRLIKRIMRGSEKLIAWEIIREELPNVFFVEFTVRNLESDSCITADYKVANSQWHEWYKLWKQQPGGFGGASGDGLDGTLPW